MLVVLGRLVWLTVKWTVAISVILVMGLVKLVQMAAEATKRLHLRAQTMPNPKRYFWLRFGIAPLIVGLVITVIVVSSSVSPTANVLTGSSDGTPSSQPVASDPPIAGTTVNVDPTASPTATAAAVSASPTPTLPPSSPPISPEAPAPQAPPAPVAPAPAPIHPGGATAQCNDGTYSYSAHRQGTCSHHGGVAIFY
jgi:hypothetical protein